MAGIQEFADYRNGFGYLYRSFGPVGFVVRKSIVPEIFPPGVKGYEQMGGFFLQDDIKQGAAKAVNSRGFHSF